MITFPEKLIPNYSQHTSSHILEQEKRIILKCVTDVVGGVKVWNKMAQDGLQ
jgi:hypothetical protein